MILKLNGLDVDCIIGERPEERTRLQRLSVDVALEIGDRAAETDELADTVDYAALAERIRRTLEESACRMIERAAKLVAGTCLESPAVRSVEVAVTKAGAVPGLASATVIHRERGRR